MMKTLPALVLLTAGEGLMQAAINQSISIDLSALHPGSTLSGTFTLSDTPKSGDTTLAVLTFSDPSDYNSTFLTATITIGDGTALPFTVSFANLNFTNPSGNSFTTNVSLMVAGAAQCASFPCSATGRIEDGSPEAFTTTYSIAPATAPTPPVPTPGGNLWGVTTQNAVLFGDGTKWQTVTGTMKQVSVAADGTVVAVDANGITYSWTGSGWNQMPVTLVQVSAGAAKNIWGVNALNNVFHWDGNSWTQMPGAMIQVSVSADGSTWALDPNGNVFSWSGAAWQAIPSTLVQVSVGSATNVWGVNAAATSGAGTVSNGCKYREPWRSVGRAGRQRGRPRSQWQSLPLDGTLWAPLAATSAPLAQISTGINGRIEDDNAALIYKGAWTKTTDPAASGGAYMVSSTAGDTMTYTFTGDTLTVYRYLDANGGQASVTIDGKPWGTILFFHADAKTRFPPQSTISARSAHDRPDGQRHQSDWLRRNQCHHRFPECSSPVCANRRTIGRARSLQLLPLSRQTAARIALDGDGPGCPGARRL